MWKILFAACLYIVMSNSYSAPPSHAMTFAMYHNGGNCNGCEWLYAGGEIVPGSSLNFEAFMKNQLKEIKRAEGDYCPIIHLDSPGGSLIEGVKLGKLFRKYKCSVSIGRSVNVKIKESPSLHEINAGECYSACAYALWGGVQRSFGGDGKYGIHQHYNQEAVLKPLEKTLTAADLSISQVLSGLLVAYAVEMGVNPLAVTAASMTTPSETIYIVPPEVAADWKIVTDGEVKASSWQLRPQNEGLYLVVSQNQDNADRSIKYQSYCLKSSSSVRNFEIIFDVKGYESQILPEFKMIKSVAFSYPKKSMELPLVSVGMRSIGKSKFMVLQVRSSKELDAFLSGSEKIEWSLDSSRANSYFGNGWIPGGDFERLNKFSMQNCI